MDSSPLNPDLATLSESASILGFGLALLDAHGEVERVWGALPNITSAWGDPGPWWRELQRALERNLGPAAGRVLRSRPLHVEVTDPDGRRRVFELALGAERLDNLLIVRDLTAETLDHERLENACRELREELQRAAERERTRAAFLSHTLDELRDPIHALAAHRACQGGPPGSEHEGLDLICQRLQRTLAGLEELVESEAARRHLAEQIELLSHSISATLDLSHVFEALLDAVEAVLPFSHAAAWVLREGRYLRVAQRGSPRLDAELVDPATPGLLGRLASTDSPLRALDTAGDADLKELNQRGVATWLGVPLLHNATRVGLLTLEAPSAEGWSELRVQACLDLAAHAGAAINNARRFAEVHRLSVIDELTGVHNRRHFMEVARRELRRAAERERPAAAIMIDVDHFKRVNDALGHHVGDEVLREVAQRCLRALRDEDIFGRYGGEEFVVLLPETSEEQALRSVAERLRARVGGTPITTSRHPVEVTISLGVAGALPGEPLDRLLERADLALLAAKRAGRNRALPPPGA